MPLSPAQTLTPLDTPSNLTLTLLVSLLPLNNCKPKPSALAWLKVDPEQQP